ncbi:hypothetical protein [Planococcus shixiaomingii]|uniref:hypothetical protein n=1 Tax=Planococcus shixiaomingii TaxID=3058393 RepID=UPI0026595A97|nr:hypothetical protein [Planococcus sp. N028]
MVTINSPQGFNVTENMEHAFRDAHGFGIHECENNPDLLVKVEQKREKEYQQSLQVAARMDNQVHRNL